MASECKDIEKLGLFYKKTIFFKKVIFENFPKNSASNEKLHLRGPFEIFEIFIPSIKIYTFFHHKNDGGKCLVPKMKPQKLFKIHPIYIGHPVGTFAE